MLSHEGRQQKFKLSDFSMLVMTNQSSESLFPVVMLEGVLKLSYL